MLQLARNKSASERDLVAKFPSCMSNPFVLVRRFKVCFRVMVGLGHPSLLLHYFLYLRFTGVQVVDYLMIFSGRIKPNPISVSVAGFTSHPHHHLARRASSPLLKVLTSKSYGRTMMNSGAKMRSWKPRPPSDLLNGLRMAMKHPYSMPGKLCYNTSSFLYNGDQSGNCFKATTQ